MGRSKFCIAAVLFIVVGCSKIDPEALKGANDKSVMLDDAHEHYHVHSPDVSHEHNHPQDDYTGHGHKHTHADDESQEQNEE